MIRALVVAGVASGVGKTTLTLGLLQGVDALAVPISGTVSLADLAIAIAAHLENYGSVYGEAAR